MGGSRCDAYPNGRRVEQVHATHRHAAGRSGDEFAVLEMRGGTHLVLTSDPDSNLVKGSFDLMVDDLDATHARFSELGLGPGDIDRGQIHDCFELREPGGSLITFNSSHVGDLPV